MIGIGYVTKLRFSIRQISKNDFKSSRIRLGTSFRANVIMAVRSAHLAVTIPVFLSEAPDQRGGWKSPIRCRTMREP